PPPGGPATPSGPAPDAAGKPEGGAPATGEGSAAAGAAPTGSGATGSGEVTEVDTSLGSVDPRASGVESLSGSQRQRSVNDSHSMLFGDQIGRDKVVVMLGGREPAPLQTPPANLTALVRHAFVSPVDWDGVQTASKNRRVIVLRAGDGHGRTGAAIRLLQSPSDRRVFTLDRNVDLHQFGQWLEADAAGPDPLPRTAGFVLCEPASWTDLQAWVLERLEATLERYDAKLVITVPADAQVPDQELMPYIQPLSAGPEPIEVLTRHLAWWLDSEDLADRVLTEPALAAFVKDVLAADQSMRTAAGLADLIAQQWDGVTIDLDRLTTRWKARTSEDFEIWFGGLSDVRTRCLAIALAVLNGLPYENVVHGALRLSELLDGPPEPGPVGTAPRPPWRDPFAGTRRQVLRLLRAQIRPTTVRTGWGAAPAEVMEYDIPGYARDVLEKVWREYQIQDNLLVWLRDLTENRSEEVRIRAATALGLLATHAFDYVFGRTLRPMLIDGDMWWVRDAVADALRVPAADPRLRPLVEAAIMPFYRNESNRIWQAGAARVHGFALGQQDPERALTTLERLVVIDDRRVAKSIADSLGELLLADEANATRVLSRLWSWLNDKKRSLGGHFVFLLLAQNLTGEPPGARPDSWPRLLLLAVQQRNLRDGLVGIWQLVLRSRALPEPTEGVLAGWADMAEADEGVRDAFTRMLAAIPPVVGQNDRTEGLVRYHIKQWRSADNLVPKRSTADAAEAALNARIGAR
ncbi:hypothetical protein AB0F81_15565, partial [Actinoplanes sp. NPDC024001]